MDAHSFYKKSQKGRKKKKNFFDSMLYELGLKKKKKRKQPHNNDSKQSDQNNNLNKALDNQPIESKHISHSNKAGPGIFEEVLINLGLKKNTYKKVKSKRLPKKTSVPPVELLNTEKREEKKRRHRKIYIERKKRKEKKAQKAQKKEKRKAFFKKLRHFFVKEEKTKLEIEEKIEIGEIVDPDDPTKVIKKYKYKYKKPDKKKKKKKEQRENALLRFFSDINIPEEGPINLKVFAIVFLNSLIIFLFTFFIIDFLNKLITIITANHFKIMVQLFYYKMDFPIGYTSPLWTFESVRTIFSAGPIFCLSIGILSYRLFMIIRKAPGLIKLFFLWMAFHGFVNFFGAYVAGVITTSRFGHVPQWFYFTEAADFVTAMFALISMIIIGWFSKRSFLQTASSYTIIKTENRLTFLLSLVIIPYIIGTSILILMKMPNNSDYDTIIHVTMLALVIPVIINYKARFKTHIYEKIEKVRFDWWYFALLILFFVIYRFGMDSGISFGVKNVIL